jgi:1-acyl-sn-glycerol-3-phosphate acyltransferase
MSHRELPWWYRLLRGLIRAILAVLCRLEVEGVEHVPRTGPFLVVVNHLHWLDIPVVGVALPHRATAFAARKWERRPIVGRALRTLGDAIFVHRGEVDRQALRKALAVLQEGRILVLAPEGTRSDTGVLQRGKEGAAYLAARSGVQLVPVVAYGQEKVFRSLRRGRRGVVRVLFGQPFTPAVPAGRVSREELHKLTEQIMLRLAALLPPAYRGVYADAVQQKTPL